MSESGRPPVDPLREAILSRHIDGPHKVTGCEWSGYGDENACPDRRDALAFTAAPPTYDPPIAWTAPYGGSDPKAKGDASPAAPPDTRPVVDVCPDCGRSDEHAAPCTAAFRVRLASYPPRSPAAPRPEGPCECGHDWDAHYVGCMYEPLDHGDCPAPWAGRLSDTGDTTKEPT